jgi:type I restriction enzyme, S subunit
LFSTYNDLAFIRAQEMSPAHRLGHIASFRNGINYTKQSKGQTVRVIGVKDFQDHFWVPADDLDRVTLDGELSAADTVSEGDILTVRSNGNPELIGRCMLVGKQSDAVTHSGFTIRIRLHSSDALPEYVCHFLKSRTIRRKLIDGGNGLNIKSLNQGTLSELLVSLPSFEIQRRLVAQIEAMAEDTARLMSLITRKLAAMDDLKKTLLHQAFAGAL